MAAVLKDDPVSIRLMGQDDVATVAAIERAAYAFPWTQSIFDDCLRVGYPSWVCESGRGIVGYALMSVGAGESHLLNLCVHPSQQRGGLGAMLLEHVLVHAQVLGAQMLFLEVRPSNRAAQRLYLRYGFNEIGRRRNYYPAAKGREDALVMAKQLDLDAQFL
ncbi:MAG: ribosomal protein S18-alanine N-acetyltransferase [Thiotrichales bacterium]